MYTNSSVPESVKKNRNKRLAGMATFVLLFGFIGFALLLQTRANNSSVSFFSDATPKVIAESDNQPVTLGFKFKSDKAGTVSGVRFYKSAQNTGTHVGTLWDKTGKALAVATFTNESDSGWQQVNFATPVSIAADTTYVASYHTTKGYYSDDTKGFATRIDKAPLHALADGEDGPNGVYIYGPASTFPTNGWEGSNYFVDVVFTETPPADTTAPTVTISEPAAGAKVSGAITVKGTAADNKAVTSVKISIDGATEQVVNGTADWSYTLDTTKLSDAQHTVKIMASDAAGNTGNAQVSIETNNKPTAVEVEKQVTKHQNSPTKTITSPSLTTTKPNELITVFVAADGPSQSGGQQVTAVAGAGLTWKMKARSNQQAGSSEVWQAVAAQPLSNVQITATLSKSYASSMVVTAFAGADTSVETATATSNAKSGAPSVTLTTARNNSVVWAVGNDWDKAVVRTLGSDQTLIDQFLASVGDTMWVQSTNNIVAKSGTKVTLNAIEPTADRYNMAAIEIAPSGSTGTTPTPPAPTPDTTAPSTPTNVSAKATSSTQANLTWTPSTDNVSVTGYKIYRNGTQVATTPTPQYSDTGLAPQGTYVYTITAQDAAGNTSAQSTAASVTTPTDTDKTAPSTPSGLKTTVKSATQIDLAWTASTDNVGVVRYVIMRDNVVIGNSSTPSFNNTGLTANTTYKYQVLAQDAAGNSSSLSTAASATTQNPADTTAPSVPTSVTPSVLSSSQINLTWAPSTDNVGVAGYNVYRNGQKVGTSTSPSFGDATLSPNTTYSYSVSAYDGAGNTSSQSTAVSAKTSSSTTTPPSQTINCTPKPSACGYPDETNTGVLAGVTLKKVPSEIKAPDASTGSGWRYNSQYNVIEIYQAGGVLQNVETSSDIDIIADNATVKNIRRIAAGRDSFGVAVRHAKNATVQDSEIGGSDLTTGRLLVAIKDIYGDAGSITVLRNDISKVSTGVQIYGGLIQDNYIHDMGYISGDHTNGTTSNGGTTQLTIRHNTSFNNRDQTDAISLFEDFGVEANRTIDNNLVAGGTYCIYAGQNAGGPATYNIKVTNNRYSRKFYNTCGQYGPLTAYNTNGSGNVLSGNVWDDTNAPDSSN